MVWGKTFVCHNQLDVIILIALYNQQPSVDQLLIVFSVCWCLTTYVVRLWQEVCSYLKINKLSIICSKTGYLDVNQLKAD